MPLKDVLDAARAWAESLRRDCPEIVRIGYFGSYARGDYGPGSDFDVLIEVKHSSEQRLPDRTEVYRPNRFPVAMELFVYTSDEIARMRLEKSSFLTAMDSHFRSLAKK